MGDLDTDGPWAEAVVTRAPYPGELPAKGSTRYVRLDGVVSAVVVQPYQEELVRKFGGCISARLPTGVYRNFLPHEFKQSPGDFPPPRRRERPVSAPPNDT